eukprot:2410686-Lingulodinium_polyedra.AAC.1
MQVDGGRARPPRAGDRPPGCGGGLGEGTIPAEPDAEHVEPVDGRCPEIHFIGSTAPSEEEGE